MSNTIEWRKELRDFDIADEKDNIIASLRAENASLKEQVRLGMDSECKLDREIKAHERTKDENAELQNRLLENQNSYIDHVAEITAETKCLISAHEYTNSILRSELAEAQKQLAEAQQEIAALNGDNGLLRKKLIEATERRSDNETF